MDARYACWDWFHSDLHFLSLHYFMLILFMTWHSELWAPGKVGFNFSSSLMRFQKSHAWSFLEMALPRSFQLPKPNCCHRIPCRALTMSVYFCRLCRTRWGIQLWWWVCIVLLHLMRWAASDLLQIHDSCPESELGWPRKPLTWVSMLFWSS